MEVHYFILFVPKHGIKKNSLDSLRKYKNNIISGQFIKNSIITCIFMDNLVKKLYLKLIFARSHTCESLI